MGEAQSRTWMEPGPHPACSLSLPFYIWTSLWVPGNLSFCPVTPPHLQAHFCGQHESLFWVSCPATRPHHPCEHAMSTRQERKVQLKLGFVAGSFTCGHSVSLQPELHTGVREKGAVRPAAVSSGAAMF